MEPTATTSTAAAAVDAAVQAMADELAESVAAMVRIPSVSGHEDDVAGWCAAWMAEHGWDVDEQPLSGTDLAAGEERVGMRRNVIGYPLGRPAPGEPVLALNGHIDVVPPGDDEDWALPPFAGVRRDGVVHGRGSTDMKGGVGAGLIAAEAVRATGIRPTHIPVVHLVLGEETTGVGTRLALRELGVPDAVIVLEPTGNQIVPVSTGLQFFEVQVPGRAAHTSAPWRGVDALARILPLREALLRLADGRSATYRHPLFAHVPTAIPFAIGRLHAGEYQASVPAKATMAGRIGLRPGEAVEDVRAAVHAALAAAAASDPDEDELPHQLRWLGDAYPGWETPADAPLVTALHDAAVAVDGHAVHIGFTAGTDTGQYAALGAAAAIFGPGDATLAHTSAEHVAEADLVRAARTLAGAMVGL
jgi:acetylornithine deacetylase